MGKIGRQVTWRWGGMLLVAAVIFVSLWLGLGGSAPNPAERATGPDSRSKGQESVSKVSARPPKHPGTRDEILQRVELLSGAEAIQSRIKELLALPNTLERQKELVIICDKLSKEVGVERATEMVSSLIGPGQIRNSLLAAVVTGANEDFRTVVSFIRGMEYSDDKEGAVNGLTNYIARNKCSVEQILACAPLEKAEVEAVVRGFIFSLAGMPQGGDSQAQVKNEVDQLQMLLSRSGLGGDEKGQIFGEYLRNLGDLYPVESLNIAFDKLGPYNDSTKGTYDGLLASAFKKDPKAAIKTIEGLLANDPSVVSPWLIRSAVQRWMKYDQDAALEWFRGSQKYGEGVKSSAAMPFFQHAINLKDLASARTWASQISDPQFKKDAEGKVWGLERDQLRAQAKQDPLQTVQGIVNGNSGFADYWLEEAMSSWFSKNEAGAIEWYQGNRNTLPTEKSQYIAAAFATKALEQKDVASARQWLDQIRDSKTRKRIESQISKVAATE